MEFAKPSGNRLHLGPRLLNRNTWLEPGDDIEIERLTLFQLFRLESQRRPNFGVVGETHPIRNNANHHVRSRVHHYGVTENIRIPAVASLPDSGAENHNIRRAEGFVLGQEQPSGQRRDAQRFEKSGGNIRAGNAIRLVIGEYEIGSSRSAYVREDSLLRAKIQPVGWRKRKRFALAFR